jgi:ATP-binding cassette subfamily B protein
MSTNRSTLRFYWQQVRKTKSLFFTGLIAIPVASLLIDTLLPFFFSMAIGSLTTGDVEGIVRNIIFASIAGVVGVGANLLGFQTLIRNEISVHVRLSNWLFKKLLSKDMRFFVNEKVGALTSRYIDFMRSYVALQDLLIIRTLGFTISIIIGLAIVASQSLLLAGIILLLIIGLLVQVRWSIKKRTPYRHARKKMTGEIHGKVADALTNNLIVKTFAGEAYETQRLKKANEKYRQLYLKDFTFLSAEGSARHFVMTATQIIALSICATLVLNGQLTLAIAIFTITYLQRMASQIFTLGEMLNGYDRALLEAAPMTEILLQPTHVNNSKGAVELQNITPRIELQDVHYKYDDGDKELIKNLNLTIEPGEKIGLVGHSGAGKTTLVHLLLRFSDVTKGAILVDGHDIREVTQESLRRQIAFVPQEPKLFHRSLRDNIAYDIEVTDDQIEAAIRQANALEFIDQLPDRLNTTVGEHGIKLSGGQRQRVAIARAILKDAPILLLDEATSALDSASEKLIQDALEKLMQGRTSIVIAHRLSTIAKLDRIIVLDKGQIIEQGTHTQLLSQKGVYADLWRHQSGGFIEE